MHDAEVLADIKSANWWQGSIVSSAQLSKAGIDLSESGNHWIVSSQTCNLYSADFVGIPVIELVGAERIDKINPALVKGDHPRTLHVLSSIEDETACFSLNILNRKWISRETLSRLRPEFNLYDHLPDSGPEWRKNQWLNLYSGWLGRSYTRVALPDEFNDALRASKIRDVLNDKLAKQGDKLYGIYLSIGPDREEPWEGILGLMPPPYLLSVKLVVDAGEDADSIKSILLKQLFEDKVEDKTDIENPSKTRAELAVKHGIRIIKQGIEAQSTEEITLDELRYFIRYSMVDHLSNASMAAPAH
ncbi:hypothetical protein [Pseudomonas viridiflava]|uniref:hypothetical protein n=1 Tax=Pseudomonas viridiflava TaxID=33069 RepID=UPI000F04DBF3|nr:hypothetical protein [Pseudomonas viridiflava]